MLLQILSKYQISYENVIKDQEKLKESMTLPLTTSIIYLMVQSRKTLSQHPYELSMAV